MQAVSLFASGGIGDLALRASGVDMVVACELLEDRADILSYNFPDSKVVVGDIWEKQDEIVSLCSGKLRAGLPLHVRGCRRMGESCFQRLGMAINRLRQAKSVGSANYQYL